MVQVEREHYLRDDISSGSALDPACDAAAAKLSTDAKHYLVVDTNIVLQQVTPPFTPTHHPQTYPLNPQVQACRTQSLCLRADGPFWSTLRSTT